MGKLDMKPDQRSQRWRDAEARCTASHADPADLAIVAEEQAKWDAEYGGPPRDRLEEMYLGKVVYHAATGVVGTAARVMMPREYESPVNGLPVPCVVIELDNGHALTMKEPRDVLVLSTGEAALAKGLQDVLAAALTNAMVMGATLGLRFEAVVLLAVSVLRQQANKIEAQRPPPDVL